MLINFFIGQCKTFRASQVTLVVGTLLVTAGDVRERCGFHPWVEKIPWRRKRQPTPVYLPGESHGQRGLAGYSPWGHRVRHN